ncbi:PEP-CTERM sorting domain-containing protein [Cylindrospermum sp. FACHB-282]|uniref:PEP-CTERM sorting domain-containing protein n=1 Tax=Cylindrospermum sp. FACHB-282 TaxID=2692794 RepID=UPI001687BBF5|nr:PEP-CTERM sorting domain-containing protein [Cylindrospermum sp. FACHB-282]MBD2387208.1 PEP-CTERM sorting domain-containing protein [Cylindrospermum sp. FACHB-282]
MKLTLFFPAFVAATGVALAVTAIPAAAAVVGCSSGSVTAGGNAYSSCSGIIIGNNRGAGTDNLEYRLNSDNLALLPQSGSALDFTKYTWTLATASLGFQPNNYNTSGTWSLGAGKSINSPFAIAVKGGPDYSAYFFNAASNITSGTWNTFGIAKGNGQPGPGLSHLDIYVATAKDVPEPLSILGTVAAFGFGGLLKRKHGNQANKEQASA